MTPTHDAEQQRENRTKQIREKRKQSQKWRSFQTILSFAFAGLLLYWIIAGFSGLLGRWSDTPSNKETQSSLTQGVNAALDQKAREVQTQLAMEREHSAALARTEREKFRSELTEYETNLKNVALVPTWWHEQLEPLFTNQEGRGIATSEQDARTLQTIYESVSIHSIEEQLRVLQTSIQEANTILDKADADDLSTYGPDQASQTQLRQLMTLLDAQIKSVNQKKAVIEALRKRHRLTTVEENTPTLAVKLKMLEAEDAQLLADQIAQAQAEARRVANLQLAQASAAKIIADATNKKTIMDANNQAAEIRTQTEAERIVMEATRERQAVAAQARSQEQAAAESSNAQEKEAQRQRLIALAKSSEVQTEFANLFKEDTWQPGDYSRNTREGTPPGPVSLSILSAEGALDDTQEGLKTFVSVFTSNRNHRGTWARPRTTQDWEVMRKRQQQLRDLGATFVELGMMAK